MLPRHLVALGDALRPVARRFRARMEAPPRPVDLVDDMIVFVSDHLRMVGDTAEDLGHEVEYSLGTVASLPEATDAQVRVVVGGVQVRLDRLLDDWDEVRRVKPRRPDRRGWRLLEDLYRDVAEQVCDWLEEAVEFLNDPAAGATPIVLTLREPTQMPALEQWAEDRSRRRGRAEAGVKRRSFWIGVLAALGLVWLFGGDE